MTDEQIEELWLMAVNARGPSKDAFFAKAKSFCASIADKTVTVPPFDDERVQIVYGLICDTETLQPQGEHWDGFVSRRIVAALELHAKLSDASIADTAGAKPEPVGFLSAAAISQLAQGNRSRIEPTKNMLATQPVYLAAPPAPSVADTAGAKPIYQVRPRNGEEWTDVSEREYHISGGAGYLQRIVFAAPPVSSVAVPGEGQEPVAYLRKDKYGNPDTVDSHIYGAFPVYAHPSAEIAALRERITDLEAVEAMRDEEIAGLREKHGNALERIAGMEKDKEQK